MPELAGAPRLAGLRDRRRRRQGRRLRAAAPPRASSAATRAGRSPGSSRRPPRSRRLRDVLWNVGKFGDLHPFAVARARPRRRRHGQAGDAAQRGGPRAQGPPRRRRGDRPARRRRHPAGRLAGSARGRAPGPRRGAAPARRVPGLRHADGQGRGRGLHQCPNSRCPDRQWQLLKHFVSRRRDGRRRPRREAGRAAAGARPGQDRRRLLPADRASRSARELDGFGEMSADNLLGAIERSKERPFSSVLFALGIEGVGFVTGRTSRPSSARSTRCSTPTRSRSPRRRASARSSAALIHDQLQDEQMRTADRRPARARPELRAGGPGARRGQAGRARRSCSPARCPTSRARRRRSGSSPRAARSRRRSPRRPTTSSRAPHAGSKLAKAERLGVAVLDEAGLLALLDR